MLLIVHLKLHTQEVSMGKHVTRNNNIHLNELWM